MTTASPDRTHLSMARFGWLAVAALALTAAQLALLPRWLSATEFGRVVLGISATQAVLQLGDLGFGRLSLNRSAAASERARLRAVGHALTLLSAAGMVAVAAVLGVVLAAGRALCAGVALGALAGAAVSAARFRAAGKEVAGDERVAASENFLWTNAPKIGLLVGVVAFRQALALLATSVAAGLLLCAPAPSRFREAVAAAREWRRWALPFASIAAGFLLTWSDTYFLSARLGVAGAGAYEAVYRVLGVCSYGFLPWVSVIVSRVSAGGPRPVVAPLSIALAATLLAAGAAGVLLSAVGGRLLPHLDLPLGTIPPLVAFYIATTVAACLGSALYVRGRVAAVTRATVISAAAAVGGHALFTLRGDAVTAAWVTATAMALNAALHARAYVDDARCTRPTVLAGG